MAEKVEDGTPKEHNGINEKSPRGRSRFTLQLSFIISFFLLIAVIFLILVEIGGTHTGGLASFYFIRIDLSHVIPTSVPNAVLLNSVARSLGLHDYYQASLWGFCSGYVGEGITTCSKPETLYWFNPVDIIGSELLAGATIAIPTELVGYLRILKIASQVMFGLFLTAVILCAILAVVIPFCRKGVSMFFASLFLLLTCIFTIVASLIATAIFTILSGAATSFDELNIDAKVGKYMLGFMWTASGATFIAFILQSAVCCCCRKRRRREREERKVNV